MDPDERSLKMQFNLAAILAAPPVGRVGWGGSGGQRERFPDRRSARPGSQKLSLRGTAQIKCISCLTAEETEVHAGRE
jgi:hypothetical protein